MVDPDPTTPTNIPVQHAAESAIAFAQSKQVIRRGIRPPNSMFGPFGEAAVVDYVSVRTSSS